MGVENYHVIELVGEGSFGKVYTGRRKFTGQILRKLKHENIIEMLDSFESPQEFCVVTEFAQGELFEILEDDKHLPFKQLLSNWYFLVTMPVYIPSLIVIPFRSRQENQRIIVCHFLLSMEKQDGLYQILAPQVKEENKEQVRAVAELAKQCLKLSSAERPTMEELARELKRLSDTYLTVHVN
ncbi:hypothetical protein ACLB2K_044443 [Fragaria x ananassa]